MELEEILRRTKEMIREHAGDDPDKLFYANRYVFARLQLAERKDKTQIKKSLIEAGVACHGCGERFKTAKDVAVHRLDGEKAYTRENCVLMHEECHRKHHAENPGTKGGRKPGKGTGRPPNAARTLSKESKRYDDKAFLYWWDIAPNGLEALKQYDAIEFVKKDTGESCHIATQAIYGFLTPERQTSRAAGNWGIRVLKDRGDALAFEPGKGGGDWLYLPVIWEAEPESEP